MSRIKLKHHNPQPPEHTDYITYAGYTIGLGTGIATAAFTVCILFTTLFINGLFQWFILFIPFFAIAYAIPATLATLLTRLLRLNRQSPLFNLMLLHFIVFAIIDIGILIAWQDRLTFSKLLIPLLIASLAAFQTQFYRPHLPTGT